MVTSCIPFNFAENSYLQKALSTSVFGVEGMTRKHISGKMLDNLSANDQASMVEKLANEDNPAGSSDGWRKKFCTGGAGLMNFCALGDSFPLLWDVKDCTGMRKSSQAIAELLLEMGTEIVGGKAPRMQVTSSGAGLLTTRAATLLPCAS
jgi:hypothetical protein